MTGKQLQNRLKGMVINGEKFVFKHLAQKLEISEQALTSKWKAKTVKDEFISEIAKALNIDETLLTTPNTLNEIDIEYNSNFKTKYMKCMEENAKLREQIIALQQQQIDQLQKE